MSNFQFIWRIEYNQTICDEKCRFGEFLNLSDNWCHECDYINKGCNSSFGCNYTSANTELKCYGCKSGYYLYLFQCIKCKIIDAYCSECHFDEIEKKFKVDKCDDKYYLNNKTGKCEIITYNEYPEVTPGCILSINNYTLYKEKKKCLLCKPGFFKTKDESCIYCKARKNGGPNCEECEYIVDSDGKTTEQIKCKNCSNGNIMTPDGKCFICVDEAGKGCEECEFVSNSNKEMKCKKCKDNYYLKEGYCIHDQSYYQNIPFCSLFDHNIVKTVSSINVKTTCTLCKNGFYKNNEDGICKGLTIEMCSYISMLNYSQPIYDECKNFCNGKEMFVNIVYKDFSLDLANIFRYNFNYKFNTLDYNIKKIIDKGYLCFSNLGKNNNNKTEPLSLRKCLKSEYIEANDKYICTECHEGYYLLENNTCRQNKTFPYKYAVDLSNCNVINIGKDSDTKEILSCESCKNESDVLIVTENGAQFCSEPTGELEGCIEAKAETAYSHILYNCTQCSLNYLDYYSRYYKRRICQSLFDDIDVIKDLSYMNLDDEELMKKINKEPAINGKCKADNIFTPDGKFCYMCNNEYFGMLGCKGSCTFSDRRNNPIECEEGKCKEGYIETSKGVCEPCDSVNEGCKFCEYVTKYPIGYHGFKTRRRFVCNECDDGYLISDDELCHHCSELGFSNCERCKVDKDNFDEFICIKCSVGYFLNEDGYCVQCKQPLVQGSQNKCIYCNNTDEGGIEGCEKCISDNGKILCQQCKEGFLLLENNQSCGKISENLELELFPNCQKIYLNENNNIYHCTQCFDGYNLLRDNNGERCVKNNFIVTPKANLLKYCKNSVNIGTEDKPWHSCNQCIGNDELLQEEREKGIVFTKIIYEENNTAYCDMSNNYKSLDNCTQAIRKIVNNEVIHTCKNCAEGNKLIKNTDQNLQYCQYYHYENTCTIKNCKTCKNSNNDSPFCLECNSGYSLVGGKCYKCPSNCKTCLNSNYDYNELVCSSCDSHYALNSTNGCTSCPNNCTSCHFDNNNNLVCEKCADNYVMNKNSLCENCSDNEEIGGIGCINCQYESNHNKCYKCRTDYIFIKNDYICKLPLEANLSIYCENAINVGDKANPRYSCADCKNKTYIKINNSLGISDCRPQKDILENCSQTNVDEFGDRHCIKCIYNYPLVWSDYYNQTICDNKCAFGFYFRNQSKWCYECDHNSYGNPGCNASLGCKYNPSNDELDCYGCKDGYFLYLWECIKCSKAFNDDKCIKCHFNSKNLNIYCDKCIDGYYFNSKTSKCENITYDEYPEVTPGYILSNNNYTLYKEKKKSDFLRQKMNHVYIAKQEKMEVQIAKNVDILKI